ncbi:trypsin domain-containing protein [Ditylenchus destructor]|nr:trypsin domain-containing protein [Ditylenchus destructor]
MGPRNWLAKLGKEELDEIRSKCTPSDQDSVVQRVLNGSPANLGDFPYVALFTADTQKRRTCTASFITYRHVLTARHCIMPKREPMLLMAGGICRSDAHKCKESGLLKVDFDFAIFQNLITREFLDKKDSTITDPESVSDILIIQLSQSVSPGWLKENQIGIVCLPLHKQVPPPEKFAVVGWGKNSLNTDANPSSVSDSIFAKKKFLDVQTTFVLS